MQTVRSPVLFSVDRARTGCHTDEKERRGMLVPV